MEGMGQVISNYNFPNIFYPTTQWVVKSLFTNTAPFKAGHHTHSLTIQSLLWNMLVIVV